MEHDFMVKEIHQLEMQQNQWLIVAFAVILLLKSEPGIYM
jgi:hypothetical protein